MKLIFVVLISLIFVNGCIDDTDAEKPPDPGDAGKVTLEGIDSDNDGVRDDIQIAIRDRYPQDNADAQVKRNALEQSAKGFQRALVAGSSLDKTLSLQASENMDRAMQCLHQVVTVENIANEVRFIQHHLLNTTARSQAYSNFNGSLNGHFFPSVDIENPCD